VLLGIDAGTVVRPRKLQSIDVDSQTHSRGHRVDAADDEDVTTDVPLPAASPLAKTRTPRIDDVINATTTAIAKAGDRRTIVRTSVTRIFGLRYLPV